MTGAIWEQCVNSLEQELSAQQFNTWIRPLTTLADQSTGEFCLMAPNRFIADWVNDKFKQRINELVFHYFSHAAITPPVSVSIKVAARSKSAFEGAAPQLHNRASNSTGKSNAINNSTTYTANTDSIVETPVANHQDDVAEDIAGENTKQNIENLEEPSNLRSAYGLSRSAGSGGPAAKAEKAATKPASYGLDTDVGKNKQRILSDLTVQGGLQHRTGLNKSFTFESFVEGKSNQMGLAAAQQVVENPGESYNPLFIYGGVGLGKTHLMHAVGNGMLAQNPNAKVVYLHSERFVADMVKALQLNAINDFKRYYRSVDALLIDDIQFFAGKDRSQEEFFHTFNALLEGNQQIILTCDRYPKVISNLEERLKSRFGWGLTVEVEPPELETRAAILLKRAEEIKIDLPYEAAFFIAQRVRSNVRELEGALKRVVANASFTRRLITVDLVKEALKDLLALQDKQVSISNIQRVVGEYYKVKVAEFTSKRRSRSVARPRQVAMALAKELTNHSLPEIGDAFGGRDHTTVLHACRKVKELCAIDAEIQQDWKNLQRLLTT